MTLQPLHALLSTLLDPHLHLLQAVLVPVLQYGCQIWGMYSPRVAAANDARAALLCWNDYYLRFWWRQTLQLWNSLAGLPIDSLYHTVCLANLTGAFQEGAIWPDSLAACLHSVGFEVPGVHDVVALLDVDGVVEALTARLQSTGSGCLYCPRAAPTQGIVSCTYEQWFKPYSPRRRSASCFWEAQAAIFCNLGWAVMACQLLLAVWLVLAMWRGLTGSFWLATVVLLAMRSI